MSNVRVRNRRRRGFTLVEALVGVVLLGIGIATALGAFSVLSNTEYRARQRERLQMMASNKLHELVATGQATASTNGDFTDDGQPDYTWNLEIGDSGITDLNTATLTVEKNNDSSVSARIDTLVYVPPVTTTGATQ